MVTELSHTKEWKLNPSASLLGMILKFIVFSENVLSLFLLKDSGRKAEETLDHVSEAKFLHKLCLFLAVVLWANNIAFKKYLKYVMNRITCPT